MHTRNYKFSKKGNIQIHTVGCELSVSDANKYACTLDPSKETIVFSTCSFLGEKEKENHIILDLLKKLHPNASFHILGCDVANNPDTYTFGTVVPKSIVKSRVAGVVDEVTPKDDLYIKIQDGCQHRCAYCIVNQLRPAPHSVPYKDIEATIKAHGGGNICIAGTEITNYFDVEEDCDLIGLLERIKNIEGVKKITLSSVDPAPRITERLIKFIHENRDIMVPYLLLATQSGCDEVLKMMGRRHNVERLEELHTLAKECDVLLGWEIITGFPGETEEMHEQTCKLVEKYHPFTDCVFTYSPRKGTPAYSYKNQVSEEEKNRRAEEIADILAEAANNDRDTYDTYCTYSGKYLCRAHWMNVVNKAMRIYSNVDDVDEIPVDLNSNDSVVNAIKSASENSIIKAVFNGDNVDENEVRLMFLVEHLNKNVVLLIADDNFPYPPKQFGVYYGCIVGGGTPWTGI